MLIMWRNGEGLLQGMGVGEGELRKSGFEVVEGGGAEESIMCIQVQQ